MIKVIFGWAAPPIKEQFPAMTPGLAEHFNEDNRAITRLRLRGYLTDSQCDSIMKKISKEIAKALEANDDT